MPKADLAFSHSLSGVSRIDQSGIWTTTKNQLLRQGDVYLLWHDGDASKILGGYESGKLEISGPCDVNKCAESFTKKLIKDRGVLDTIRMNPRVKKSSSQNLVLHGF
jgi:hypothetical protein